MTSDVGVPTPYPKRALIAVVVSMPMAFGLNIPLNSAIPIWGLILINAIVISSYMAFMVPKSSTLASSWLNKQKEVI